MSAFPTGRFVWYELHTNDPESAVRYYMSLLGWGTTVWEGGPTPYTMWTNRDVPVAGLLPLQEHTGSLATRPGWLPYIGVPEVDAAADKATTLGAAVCLAPMSIASVGRMAVLTDPQGAVFALFTPDPNQSPQPERPAQLGEFSWHELATTDGEAGFRFYQALFGWVEKDVMDVGGGMLYRLYGRKETDLPLGGMYTMPAEAHGLPAWVLYAVVPDADKGAAKAAQLGGKVIAGPMEVPGGDRVVQCLDPQGAMFAMHALAQQPAGRA